MGSSSYSSKKINCLWGRLLVKSIPMSTRTDLIDKQMVLEGLKLRFPGVDSYALGLAGMRALREQKDEDGPDELLKRVQRHLKQLELHATM